MSQLYKGRGVHVVLVSLFGRPIVRSISHFFGRPRQNCPFSETGQFFFVHSLEFFVQSFLKIGHSLISRVDKKVKRVDKKIVRSLKWVNFFWPTPKNEKLNGQLVGQETDQNHMDVPLDYV